MIYPRLLTGFGLLHKLKSYGISGQIFGLISFFLSNRRLRVVLDGKSSQEHPVNAGVPQGSILGLKLFLLYSNDFPVILLSILLILLSILSVIRHLICGNELKWPLNLNLIYETLWTWASGLLKTLLISVLGKPVSFDWSNDIGAIDVKMDGSVLEEKSSFKMLGLTFSSKLDWVLTLSLLLKLHPRKLEL